MGGNKRKASEVGASLGQPPGAWAAGPGPHRLCGAVLTKGPPQEARTAAWLGLGSCSGLLGFCTCLQLSKGKGWSSARGQHLGGSPAPSGQPALCQSTPTPPPIDISIWNSVGWQSAGLSAGPGGVDRLFHTWFHTGSPLQSKFHPISNLLPSLGLGTPPSLLEEGQDHNGQKVPSLCLAPSGCSANAGASDPSSVFFGGQQPALPLCAPVSPCAPPGKLDQKSPSPSGAAKACGSMFVSG